MTTVALSTISDEDLLRAQDEAGVELVNGQLVVKPASVESSEIEGTIYFLLRQEAARDNTVRVFPASLGYRCFPDDPAKFRKPDVSVIRVERLARVPAGSGLMPIPPDLAVEVLSTGDNAESVAEKVEEYLAAGFPLIWVVRPSTRTVLIHRADLTVAIVRVSHLKVAQVDRRAPQARRLISARESKTICIN